MPSCQRCGTDRKFLHRHHLNPRSLGGTDEPENIMRLCPNCHEDIHGGPYGGVDRLRTANSPEANAKRAASMKAAWARGDFKNRSDVRTAEQEERRLTRSREARAQETAEQRAEMARNILRGKRRLTAERDRRIVWLFNEGRSQSKISRIVDCAIGTVTKVVRAHKAGTLEATSDMPGYGAD